MPVVDTLAYFGALRGLALSEARKRATKLLTDVSLRRIAGAMLARS